MKSILTLLAVSGVAAVQATVFETNVAQAETIAQVLATRGSSVEIYDISNQGLWTLSKTFCKPASGYQAYGSICHNGIVYVAEAVGLDADSGKVRRFDLNGTELAPMPNCPFRPENFAVSPNGQYLFVSCGAGGSGPGRGELYRYDLTQGTTGEWVCFAKSGVACMRAVDIDKNGDVFWASRGSILYAGNCYATDDLPHGNLATYTAGFLCGLRCANDGYIYFSSSKSDKFIGGKVQWNSETKKFGAATTVSTVDESIAGWSDDVILIDGEMYFSAMTGSPLGIFHADLEAKRLTTVVSSASPIYSLELVNVKPGLVWKGGAEGSFSNAANWDPARVPVSGDVLVFTNNVSIGESSGPVDVGVSGMTFDVAEGVTLTSSFSLTGNGGVTKNGTGMWHAKQAIRTIGQ